MHQLERYVDAQYGGPGKGWYRIVTDPYQARRVINQGKLAVVMGIETSVLFGCTMKPGVPDPSCTTASIDRQLDEVRKMGVTQMELVNKFDNALSGVAGDEGADRRPGQLRQLPRDRLVLARCRHCPPTYPEVRRARTRTSSVPPDSNPITQRRTRCSAPSRRPSASSRPSRCPSTRREPTATIGPDRPRRAHHPRAWPSGT